MPTTVSPPLCPKGTVIKNRWRVVDKLGAGSFGEIYEAVDESNEKLLAVKVEKSSAKRTILRLEIIALRHLQPCARVVRYVHCGQCRVNDTDLKFLVMEKLGDNLAHLRKLVGEGGPNRPRFSMSTSLRLGIQMIECLEGVHKMGYVHRDIKPSNFVVSLPTSDQSAPVMVHIIDFGLARKYVLQTGAIRPARASAGFRGTVRYASISSHEQKELGPHDDLWSVFYSLVEFATGSLPWMRMRDKGQVLELKRQYTNEQLVVNLPGQFLQFMNHLKTLRYGQLPDYDYLKDLLWAICKQEGYEWNDAYDWQKPDSRQKIATMKDSTPVESQSTKFISQKPDGLYSSSTNHVSRSTLQSSSRSTGQLQEQKFYSIVQHPPIENKNIPEERRKSITSSQQAQMNDHVDDKCKCAIM